MTFTDSMITPSAEMKNMGGRLSPTPGTVKPGPHGLMLGVRSKTLKPGSLQEPEGTCYIYIVTICACALLEDSL